MPTSLKVWFYVWKRCSQKCYAFVSLTKARAAVTSLDLWGIELALRLLFWAPEYLLVCCSLISWRKYIHTHNETSSIIKFLFNCQGWASKGSSEATETVRQVQLLRLKGGMWLKASEIYLDLLKRSLRRYHWKTIWGIFVLFLFLDLVLAPFGTFKFFGCYLWANIFYRFHSERAEMKERNPKIILPIPNFQTLKCLYWRFTGQR